MKVRACFCLAMVLAVCFAASVAHATLQDDVDQAVSIIERFEEIPESAIPPRVLRDAKGLAILSVTKAGYIVSGRGRVGVVVARTDTGWSGPSAIGTGGLGVGFQAGVQVSEYVIILNTQEAVNAFAKGSNVTLGGNLSAAIGPIGRSAESRRRAAGGDLYLQPQSRNICWCVTGGHGRRDSVRSKRRILRQAGFSG